MSKITDVTSAMICYFSGDPKRINHFLKVHSYASLISEKEKVDKKTKKIIEIAALTHDIGIKNSEIKYNSSAGSYQEIEGPPEARKILKKLKIEEEMIERVCWLIAHHHTYDNINGKDYQILVEADFLVNIYEEEMSAKSISKIKEKIFKTEYGIELMEQIFSTMDLS